MTALDFYRELGVNLGNRTSGEAPVRCFNADAHRNGDRKASASINLETGQWRCHGCGACGSAYDAALAHGRAPADAQQLAERHGLWADDRSPGPAVGTPAVSVEPARRSKDRPPASDAQLSRWQTALRDGAVDRLTELRGWTPQAIEQLGLGLDRERIVFPVRDAAGELVGVLRYAPNADQRKGRKMLAGKGSKRELFPAVESLNGAKRVWIVEGEPDAVAAASLGLPAVGLPGVESWREDWAARFTGRQVVVCLDSDAPGRKAAAHLARALLPHASEVRVLDLDPARDDGYDIGNLLLEAAEHGDDGRRELHELLERSAELVEPLERPAVDDAAGLLDATVRFLRRFVHLPSREAGDALALWVIHTHAVAAADTTLYLTITSPERQCGKTLLLELLGLLSARAWRISAPPTEAVLFRKIEAEAPTLLLDECDRLFKASGERVEPLVALLNAGNRRGATVPRCVGEGANIAIRDFAVFSAKALAGINHDRWPDTIRDRAVAIKLERRAPGEHIERFRRRQVEGEAVALRDSLAAWGAMHIAALEECRPALIDELSDRAFDAWEPLFAIAQLAGRDWPERARAAALKLSAGHEPETDSLGVRLLSDLRGIFGDRDRLTTGEALTALRALDEAPWADLGENGITSRKLADLLRSYDVLARTIRQPDGTTSRGWLRDQFASPWLRYLPGEPGSSRHSDTSRSTSGIAPGNDVTHNSDVSDAKTAEIPHDKRDVSDVSDAMGNPPDAGPDQECGHPSADATIATLLEATS